MRKEKKVAIRGRRLTIYILFISNFMLAKRGNRERDKGRGDIGREKVALGRGGVRCRHKHD